MRFVDYFDSIERSVIFWAIPTIIKHYTEGKMRAFAKARADADLSVEAFDDVFWDDEPQADTLRVHSLRICYFSKEFE